METHNEQYSDLDIIQKVVDGDIKLFEILIRRYNSFLYKIARSYSYNHQDAEDLMQETYISVYKSLHKFEKRASFKTWITRIMLNQCYHKKQKFSFKNEIITNDIQSVKSNPMFQKTMNNEKITVNKELGHVLENAVQSIPENYRVVFTLREMNGLSVAETSSALDISESNVKVRLNRAKSMLRTEVEKFYSPKEIFEFNLIYCDAMVDKVMSQINDLKKIEI